MRGVNRPVPKGYPGHPNDACELGPSVRALTTAEYQKLSGTVKSQIKRAVNLQLEYAAYLKR